MTDPEAPSPPGLTFVFVLRVAVADGLELGRVRGERRRFVPILGGTVEGPRLSGRVLAGGGDWQAIHDDGRAEILARYALEADDGASIGVLNPGLRIASPDVTRRLLDGEAVPSDHYYFRTAPVFEVDPGPHGWLRERLFVGRGIREPGRVRLDVFAID